MKPKLTVAAGASAESSREDLRWITVNRQEISSCKIFSVNRVLAERKAEDKKTGSFYTLKCGPWVNVVAITSDNRLVMVEQYRHGIESLTLEIPGGSIETFDADPRDAAVRELLEETGCVAERWSFLGKNHPNPALQDNLCYTYLAEGTRQVEEPRFDDSGTERLITHYVELSQLNSLILDGSISHALVITALHFLLLRRPDLLSGMNESLF